MGVCRSADVRRALLTHFSIRFETQQPDVDADAAATMEKEGGLVSGPGPCYDGAGNSLVVVGGGGASSGAGVTAGIGIFAKTVPGYRGPAAAGRQPQQRGEQPGGGLSVDHMQAVSARVRCVAAQACGCSEGAAVRTA